MSEKSPSALTETLSLYFGPLQDPRVLTRNRRHLFEDIIALTIIGVICGCNTWTSINDYATAKQAWLSTFLSLPNGIPSHDTLNDVFSKIDPDQFETCFIHWVQSIAHLLPGGVIAVDGKTVRRSHDAAENKKAIHIISAWSTANSVVLGQVKTDEKSNEITAIPELLQILSIKKSLVTIDAMGCQKKIAEAILAKGADYMLAVKENQPTLHEEIQRLFLTDEDQFAEACDDFAEQSNRGHGREETRKCWVSYQVDELEVEPWPSLKSVIMLESTRTIDGKTSHELRFYISSKQESAAYFLECSRAHWEIENKLHWSLDVGFREDECRIRKGDGARNLALVRKIALNLLKKDKSTKSGLEAKRMRAGWDNDYLLRILSGILG